MGWIITMFIVGALFSFFGGTCAANGPNDDAGFFLLIAALVCFTIAYNLSHNQGALDATIAASKGKPMYTLQHQGDGSTTWVRNKE